MKIFVTAIVVIVLLFVLVLQSGSDAGVSRVESSVTPVEVEAQVGHDVSSS